MDGIRGDVSGFVPAKNPVVVEGFVVRNDLQVARVGNPPFTGSLHFAGSACETPRLSHWRLRPAWRDR